jgi:phosphoglycerate dehydrogenase-like enzyme
LFTELNRRAEAYARERDLEYVWAPQLPFSEEDVVARLREADAGIIDVEPYGEPIFRRIKDRTKLLVRFGVGYDKVDLAAASRAGIAVARTTGANTGAVAELALTLILTCSRRLKLAQTRTESGIWVKDVGHETIGAAVGILGYGSIGRKLRQLLRGFGCRVLVCDHRLSAEEAEREEVERVSLEELFARADAVSIHIPFREENRRLVDEGILGLMKPTAVLVNTARGGIVDEDALYRALKAERIAGAGLDVYAREPLPVPSPLLELPNCVLTPHIASQTVESLWNIYSMALDIASDFFAGRGSPHILNPDHADHA